VTKISLIKLTKEPFFIAIIACQRNNQQIIKKTKKEITKKFNKNKKPRKKMLI